MMDMQPTHNLFLVGLSFCISVFGSYTGLQLVRGIRSSSEKSRIMWVVAAAFALGGGAIWTMHFIGMLAYDMGMPVSYDPGITFISLFIAIFVVGAGLYFLSTRQNSLVHLLLAGVITGLGVASMHYSGMEAMVTAADMSYDKPLFALSVIIAIVAATVALWLAFNLEGSLQMLGAAFIMGIAVCGMHYTGMAGMIMTHNPSLDVPQTGIKPLTLGLFIFCFSMLLLVLCLIVTLSQLNRKMYEALEAEDDEEMDGQTSQPHLLKATL